MFMLALPALTSKKAFARTDRTNHLKTQITTRLCPTLNHSAGIQSHGTRQELCGMDFKPQQTTP